MSQLARAGAPVIYGGCPIAFDMRLGTTPAGAIESMMMTAAYAQVGKHLKLPTHGYLVLSDSKCLDYQAGFESGMGAVLAVLAGINVVSGPGMLDCVSCQSFEKVLLDHEMCGQALRLARGVARREGDTEGHWYGVDISFLVFDEATIKKPAPACILATVAYWPVGRAAPGGKLVPAQTQVRVMRTGSGNDAGSTDAGPDAGSPKTPATVPAGDHDGGADLDG